MENESLLPGIDMPEGEDSAGFSWGEAGDRPFGLTEKLARYAFARTQGLNQSQSARWAGYACGNEAGFRSQGSQAERSKAVQACIVQVKAAHGEKLEPVAEADEIRRILSQKLRAAGTKASEAAQLAGALKNLESADEAERRQRLKTDPVFTLNQLIEKGGLLNALLLGQFHGYTFDRERHFAVDAKDELRRVRFRIVVEPLDERGKEIADWIEAEAARRRDPHSKVVSVSRPAQRGNGAAGEDHGGDHGLYDGERKVAGAAE